MWLHPLSDPRQVTTEVLLHQCHLEEQFPKDTIPIVNISNRKPEIGREEPVVRVKAQSAVRGGNTNTVILEKKCKIII